MSKSLKALCLFCLSLFLILALIPAQAESSETGLHIYFLDVGQGDAAIISLTMKPLMAPFMSFMISFS